jgi:hypothetical protein
MTLLAALIAQTVAGVVVGDELVSEPSAGVERRLNPVWETVVVPFFSGMTLAGLAGFARS